MGQRRAAREIALQAVYLLEQAGFDADRAAAAVAGLPLRDEELFPTVPEPAPAESYGFYKRAMKPSELASAREFALSLVNGTSRHREDIDAAITAYTRHWLPDRMASVDRAVLRIALYEILFSADAPPKAAINEWIELAKKYSTEESGAFVNGILDRAFKDKERGVK